MITYTEKGFGLHEAIALAGHWLGQDGDGVWHSSDDEAVQAIIDSYVPKDLLPPLLPAQFEYLLSLTGLDDVWAELETFLKGLDREMYAKLRGSRKRETFQFAETLRLIGEFQPYLPPQVELPDEDQLKVLWTKALNDF